MRKFLALLLVLTPLALTGCFHATDGDGDDSSSAVDAAANSTEETSESAAVEAAERGNQ